MRLTNVRLNERYMHRFVAQCYSAARRNIRDSLAYLKPLIDERKAKMEAYGDDYPEKPVRSLPYCIDFGL